MVFLFAVFMPLKAEQAIQLVTKSSQSVQSLCWSNDGIYFAVGAEDSVRIINTYSGNTECTVPVSSATFLGFATENISNSLILVALSGSGNLSAWNINGMQPVPVTSIIDTDKDLSFTSCAFSPNSNFIAAGMEDGSIQVFFKLRYAKQFLTRESHEQKGRIHSITFSKDSRFMASASDDGTVVLYESASGEICARIPVYSSAAKSPVAFSSDGMLACVVSGSRDILFYDINGRCRKGMTTRGIIQAVEFVADGDTLAVQTSDGEISFYTPSNDKRFAYIPSCNITGMNAFAFSEDGSTLLEGYADGSVYRIEVAEAMQYDKDTASAEKDEYVAQDNQIIYEQQDTYEEPESYEEKEEDLEPKPEPVVKEITEQPQQDYYNSIVIYGGGIMLPKPFSAAIAFGAAFKQNTMVPPFYFGIGLDIQIGFAFDSSDFPYNYYMDGSSLAPPHTGGFTLYAPVGASFNIGRKEKPVRLFAELHAGVRDLILWQSTKKGFIKTDTHLMGMAGVYIGVEFNGFQVQAGFDYDKIQKFTPGIFFGYGIKLKGKGNKK